MGMSASQARLLSITARMNDVEYKSQQIANTKIRLSDESEQVANAYTKALNKQKFTYTDYSSGSAVKVDLDSSTLANYGLKLVPRNATPQYRLVPLRATDGVGVRTFATKMEAQRELVKLDPSYADQMSSDEQTASTSSIRRFSTMTASRMDVSEAFAKAYTPGTMDNFIDNEAELNRNVTVVKKPAIKFRLEEFYPEVPTTFSASDLYEMIESGQFYLEGDIKTTGADGVETSTRGEISVTSSTSMAIETDSTELAKAEADYNAATAKINKKEKLLDNGLKALDTEHSALSTEYDSVKSLIGDNIKKSFQLFS